jgi:hypothetical protein
MFMGQLMSAEIQESCITHGLANVGLEWSFHSKNDIYTNVVQ